MISNEHVLSGNRDQWFLHQNRTEGVTGDTFQAGDHIVVCSGCKRVWFAETWNIKDRCPSPDCRSQETRPFEKNIFALKKTEGMRIKFKRGQVVKAVSAKKARGYKRSSPRLSEMWNRITHICFRAFPPIKCVLIGAAIGLTVLQLAVPTSVFHKKPAAYYRTVMVEKFQKAGESFSANFSDIAASAADAFVKVKTSAGNGASDTFTFGGKIRQSAADGIDKILHHENR